MKWPKDDFRRGFLYGVVFVLMIFVCLVLLFGCWSKHIIPAEPSTMANTIIKTVKVNDWLVTGGILIMGLGMFGFVKGLKWGIALMIAAGTVVGISLILKAYGAILVFLGAICIAGFVAWQIWIRIKELNLSKAALIEHKKALAEVVKNVEIMKIDIDHNQPAETIKQGLLCQSSSTKSLVAGIRKKLNGATK